ncbi:MAG: SlyX family protein [Mesorhizobium sp.]
MAQDVETRLTKLELLAAEQEHTIGELSAEIAKAWKIIDELTRRIEAMSLRLTGVEEATAPEVPVTKPPHW